jgi:phosphoserine phosphatase
VRIGLDLDNTLIDYSHSYSTLATQFGLADEYKTRWAIRARLRDSPPRDYEWQRFQYLLYTQGLQTARISAGAIKFMLSCKGHNDQIFIVSHKTRLTSKSVGLPIMNLRDLARDFLVRSSVIPHLVVPHNIYFEETQEKKVDRLNSLELDVVVDDLEEVLGNPLINPEARLILYGQPQGRERSAFEHVESFFELSQLLGRT